MTDRPQLAPRHTAIRLLVAYDGDQLNVIDRRRVEMTTPASDPIQGFAGQSGFWYELRDANDNVLYRRIAENPVKQEVEAFEPDGSATRHVVDRPSGVFTVLVPDIPEADHVAIVSGPLTARQTFDRPAELLTRLPLREPQG